jgi:hypothetical protein
MSIEEEFTEFHKDSFVRAKSGEAGARPSPQAPRPSGAPAVSPSTVKESKVDDYVPEQVGKVVDNVFGKLDNLVNDAADYLFGSKKKSGGLLEQDVLTPARPPAAVPPLAPRVPVPKIVPPVVSAPPPLETKPTPTARKAVAPKPRVTTLSTLQSSARSPDLIRGVMPEVRPKYEGPVVNRTTSISELELPLEILDDPDLVRYFDQMKLYESPVVTGGLCNSPVFEAVMQLKKGYWQHRFKVRFEDLKNIQPGINPMEMARSRFAGMRPVYKAQAWLYNSHQALLQAIEEDINAYLNGESGKHFHKFVYQVVSHRYR